VFEFEVGAPDVHAYATPHAHSYRTAWQLKSTRNQQTCTIVSKGRELKRAALAARAALDMSAGKIPQAAVLAARVEECRLL
jgi:hypothetical protein